MPVYATNYQHLPYPRGAPASYGKICSEEFLKAPPSFQKTLLYKKLYQQTIYTFSEFFKFMGKPKEALKKYSDHSLIMMEYNAAFSLI